MTKDRKVRSSDYRCGTEGCATTVPKTSGWRQKERTYSNVVFCTTCIGMHGQASVVPPIANIHNPIGPCLLSILKSI